MKTRSFLKQLDHDCIVEAIRRAESKTTGELRVHVSNHAVQDVEAEAAKRFESLGMTATRERNGVLLYLAPRTRRFAVIGDQAIHARCGHEFWTAIAAAMESKLRAGRFTEAIIDGVERAGEALARLFPRGAGNPNELTDEVSED